MRIFHAWIMAVVMLLADTARAEPEALKVGVVPYLTTNVLITLFQPVRNYLEQRLGRPVELYTAQDVRTFVRRTLKPEFDVVITAAHHARLAQVEAGYVPLVRFTGPLHAAVAVASNSPLREPKELRGRRIAITDRSILVNIVTMKLLADMGIAEKDLQLTPVNSQNTGLLTVARGEAEAAIIAHFTIDQIPAEQRAGIRVLYKSEVLPNVTILAKPSLGTVQQDALRQALLDFPATAEGQAFLQKSRFLGIQAASEDFMKQLDGYLPETRRQLAP